MSMKLTCYLFGVYKLLCLRNISVIPHNLTANYGAGRFAN